MKQLFFSYIFILVATVAVAQQTKTGKLKFQSLVQLGFVEGNAGNAFQLQAINSFDFNCFSAGIGVGLDYYGTRSVPLFIDLRKNILRKPQTPFIYLDAGMHFPWNDQRDEGQIVRSRAGLFYEAGIGYNVPVKTHAITFSAGYSYKAFKEEIKSPVWCVTGRCANDVQKLSYQFRRISIKAGFRF